uniref:Nucleocapsid n=1 Tax=Measles morbillivirus TaxID=11234 RepID=A0A0U3CD78_9MONO|nr:nucleoprotein [Measles morbillivirus]
MVRRSAGKVSSTLASELGITAEDARLVSEIAMHTTEDRISRAVGPRQAQVSFLHGDQSESELPRLGGKEDRRVKQNRGEAGESHRGTEPSRASDVRAAHPPTGTPLDIDTASEFSQDPQDSRRSADALLRLQAMAGISEEQDSDRDTPRVYNHRHLLD